MEQVTHFWSQNPCSYYPLQLFCKTFLQTTIIITPLCKKITPFYRCATRTHRSPAGPLQVQRAQAPAGLPAGAPAPQKPYTRFFLGKS